MNTFHFGDIVKHKKTGELFTVGDFEQDEHYILAVKKTDAQAYSVNQDLLELVARPVTLPTSHIERMENELSGLTGKLEKLKSFFTTDTFKSLPSEKCELMLEQCSAMSMYRDILERRIKLEKNK